MINDDMALPPPRPWTTAAVRILQGVVYSREVDVWDAVLRNRSDLTDHFAAIGLVMIVDEADGLAYLRQIEPDDPVVGDGAESGYENVPRLFRRTKLSYETTLMAVLLRDELRRFEEEDLDSDRCVVRPDALLDTWKAFFPSDRDDVWLRRQMNAAINKLVKLKFVSELSTGDYEVRAALKARLPLATLTDLRDRLADHSGTLKNSPS